MEGTLSVRVQDRIRAAHRSRVFVAKKKVGAPKIKCFFPERGDWKVGK